MEPERREAAKVEARPEELGLVLPAPVQLPPGAELPFAWVRGDRAHIFGQGPLNTDGSLSGPFGRVGAEVSAEEGYEAARGLALGAR